jgi:hypothetical protein
VSAAVLAIVLVLVVAATPLSAVVSAGHFELRLFGSMAAVGATLDDETNLVQSVLAAPGYDEGVSASGRYLTVGWIGGCDNAQVTMRFSQREASYVLTEHTTGEFCQLLIGFSRTFVLVLYKPIDPAAVEIVHV